ncbi:MAG: penicillin-binding protein activator [Hyphomicrobiales bacterium]|nr:penicillin-binding protein activator [Hyphomicrobiales bacterium]
MTRRLQRAATIVVSSHHQFLRAISFIVCSFVLASCSIGGGSNVVESEPIAEPVPAEQGIDRPAIKVAMLLPLSGNAQNVAKALKQAGELALFDFDNPNVELISKDTRGTPAGAKSAAEEAVSQGVELVIGPLFANEVKAAAPVTQAANIPMIAFSSDQKVAGDGVYLLSFLAGSDVQRIISYAVSRGKSRFAALIPQTDYGRLVQDRFIEAARDMNVSVLAVKEYPQDANGMIEPVKEIAALVPKDEEPQIDALFMPAAANTLPALAPLLPYNEIDTKTIQLLGTSGWDYQGVGKEEAVVGAWFPAPDPKGWTDFTKRYVETYSEVPTRLATLGYDAVSLAIALSNNRSGSRYTAKQLTRANGFSGVDGLFRLRADGTSQRGFAILEVQKYGNQVIKAAPNGFTSAQY